MVLVSGGGSALRDGGAAGVAISAVDDGLGGGGQLTFDGATPGFSASSAAATAGIAGVSGATEVAGDHLDAGDDRDASVDSGASAFGAVQMPYASIGWEVTASITAPGIADLPSNVIDGNIATRWTTGRPQEGGESFLVDFGKVIQVRQVVLDDTAHPTDYPAAYAVDLSNDGTTFVLVDTGEGVPVTVSCFPESTARFMRIRQTDETPMSWWSIDELRVYP